MAIKALQTALRVGLEGDVRPSAIASVAKRLAELLLRDTRPAEALEPAALACAAAREAGSIEGRCEALAVLGDVLTAQGQTEDALDAYKAAVGLYQVDRTDWLLWTFEVVCKVAPLCIGQCSYGFRHQFAMS